MSKKEKRKFEIIAENKDVKVEMRVKDFDDVVVEGEEKESGSQPDTTFGSVSSPTKKQSPSALKKSLKEDDMKKVLIGMSKVDLDGAFSEENIRKWREKKGYPPIKKEAFASDKKKFSFLQRIDELKGEHPVKKDGGEVDLSLDNAVNVGYHIACKDFRSVFLLCLKELEKKRINVQIGYGDVVEWKYIKFFFGGEKK